MAAPNVQAAKLDSAKLLQNRTFKRFGGLIAVLASLGFAPSYVKTFTNGVLWSGAANAPIPRPLFLWSHAVCMPVWLLCVFIQIATGGTKFKRVHRASGYTAVIALALGLSLASAALIFQWRIGEVPTFQTAFQFMFVVATSINAVFGIRRAVQKRTAEHKDFMLMTIFWSFEPAIIRFVVWALRWSFPKDFENEGIVWLADIPWHFFMTGCLMLMVTLAKRLNVVTLTNVYARFAIGILLACVDFKDVPNAVKPAQMKANIACFSAFCCVMLTLSICACRAKLCRSSDDVMPKTGISCDKV